MVDASGRRSSTIRAFVAHISYYLKTLYLCTVRENVEDVFVMNFFFVKVVGQKQFFSVLRDSYDLHPPIYLINQKRVRPSHAF